MEIDLKVFRLFLQHLVDAWSRELSDCTFRLNDLAKRLRISSYCLVSHFFF